MTVFLDHDPRIKVATLKEKLNDIPRHNFPRNSFDIMYRLFALEERSVYSVSRKSKATKPIDILHLAFESWVV